jgi:CRISPR/Cas system-associated exonuclease Cas4 (RecB family)
MTPHAKPKGAETSDERAMASRLWSGTGKRGEAVDFPPGVEPKVLVPVSALGWLLINPSEVYDRFVRGRRREPTPPMVAGEMEHLARRLAVERLWETYLKARSDDDLREGYGILHESVKEAAQKCSNTYSGLGISLLGTESDLLNRMRIEEDARVIAASNLMKDGVRGFELVRHLLPTGVEVSVRSHGLGLEGRIDAIGDLGGNPVPIEYKTGREGGSTSLAAHEVQVAAYCMLLEEDRGTPCRYGEIHYTRYFARRPVFVTDASRNRVIALRDRFIAQCTGEPDSFTNEEVAAHE